MVRLLCILSLLWASLASASVPRGLLGQLTSATRTFNFRSTDAQLDHESLPALYGSGLRVAAETYPAGVARRRVSFAYDFLGRRVQKISYSWSGTGWAPSDTRFFVYDGWNLLAELKQRAAGPGLVRSFLWGLDLSGSLQGAGGVGGLLGMVDASGASALAYCAVNDHRGNVVGLVDASGNLVAEYEYSPFGELLRAVGTAATACPVRFSSKYYDLETDLVNFGFRYYSPGLGRFLNRDPQEELGRLVTLSDVDNGGVSAWSYIGKAVGEPSKDYRYQPDALPASSTMAHSADKPMGGYRNTTLPTPASGQGGGGAGAAGGMDVASAAAWSHAYGFLDNSPCGGTEYLGLAANFLPNWVLQPAGWLSDSIAGAAEGLQRSGELGRIQSELEAVEYGVGRTVYDLTFGSVWESLANTDFNGNRLTRREVWGAMGQAAVDMVTFGLGTGPGQRLVGSALKRGLGRSVVSRTLGQSLAAEGVAKFSDEIPLTGIARFDQPAVEATHFNRFLDLVREQGFRVKSYGGLSERAVFKPNRDFVYNPNTMTVMDMLHEIKHIQQFQRPGFKVFGNPLSEAQAYNFERFLPRPSQFPKS